MFRSCVPANIDHMKAIPWCKAPNDTPTAGSTHFADRLVASTSFPFNWPKRSSSWPWTDAKEATPAKSRKTWYDGTVDWSGVGSKYQRTVSYCKKQVTIGRNSNMQKIKRSRHFTTSRAIHCRGLESGFLASPTPCHHPCCMLCRALLTERNKTILLSLPWRLDSPSTESPCCHSRTSHSTSKVDMTVTLPSGNVSMPLAAKALRKCLGGIGDKKEPCICSYSRLIEPLLYIDWTLSCHRSRILQASSTPWRPRWQIHYSIM